MDLADSSAFQGPKWKPRRTSLADEIDEGTNWAPFSCDSEWGRLTDVLLYEPGESIGDLEDPDEVQHLRTVDYKVISRQHSDLAGTLQALGVAVHHVRGVSIDDKKYPNAMFQRDLFWQTPQGSVMSRMASMVRAGEEQHTARTLTNLGVPILLTVHGTGTFEGADALWLNPNTVLCGLGRRTNKEGCRQIRTILEAQKVHVFDVKLPPQVQHLLGCVQIVSPERALVRTEIVGSPVCQILRKQGFDVVAVPETDEVVHRTALNFVVIGRDSVLLAEEAPRFARFLEAEGVEVKATVACSEYIKAAGGLACATGILARQPL